MRVPRGGEARIAALVAGGRSIEECAGALGLSRETARTYLKNAMAKTGTHRQSAS